MDRLLAHETAGTASAYAHLQTCAQCQERYAACAAEQRARLTEDVVQDRVDALVAALGSARAPQRWHQRLGRRSSLLALVVLAFFLGLWPHLHGDSMCSHACPAAAVTPDASEATPAKPPSTNAPGF